MRPHWDDVWLGVAQVIARRSLCTRAQVGAVIVDDRYRIVSSGYNGPPHGFDHRDEPCTVWCARAQGDVLEGYGNCPSLHAEANALMAADRSAWQGGVLYVTGHICNDCAKLVGNSGLSRVVVQEDGIDRSYRAPENGYAFIRALGIGVEIVQSQLIAPVDDEFMSQRLQSGITVREYLTRPDVGQPLFRQEWQVDESR